MCIRDSGATTLATTDAASNTANLTLDADGAINLDAGNDTELLILRGGVVHMVLYTQMPLPAVISILEVIIPTLILILLELMVVLVSKL